MQRLLQNIRSGRLTLADTPAPLAADGEVLIANRCSLVSAGTEKAAMELARKSLLGKARERPDHLRRVLEKARNEGVLETARQVRERLDEPMSMGYSSAGIVLACGRGVREYKPGDRVASNGPHAEIVSVPRHLCARVPETVPFEQAAFTVLGAVALQGVRLSKVSLGETAFVIGLGLVGQLTVALLKAAGCRVIGTDPQPEKCELALKMGADVARPHLSAGHVEDLTGGLGADAVLITASTKSNGPVDQAAQAVRKKGRVVLVGTAGLNLDRRPFYFKEAELMVSCSYGPGRYDPHYEQQGHDYPAAHVRWTEGRNLQAVLDMMAAGRLDVGPLISHRFPMDRALEAYDLIRGAAEPYLGIVLEYPQRSPDRIPRRIRLNGRSRNGSAPRGRVGIGVLGAGHFARMVLLPAIRKCPELHPVVLCSAGGASAVQSGKRLGYETATTDEDAVFSDPAVQAVVSITRHNQHAGHVLKAIHADKPIFVEKPLGLRVDELAEIEAALAERGGEAPLIMVGFNRRFAPATALVERWFEDVNGPLSVSIRFNAGDVPGDHWIRNEDVGGGRIVGEACHAIDLASCLTGSPPVRVFAESAGGPDVPEASEDSCFITLRHADGSISNVAYLAGGDRALPKERVEVFGGGRAAVIDDFRSVTTCRGGRMKTKRLGRQDKGHRAEIEAFARAVKGGPAPIPWHELCSVSLAAILAVRSLREGVPFEVTPLA